MARKITLAFAFAAAVWVFQATNSYSQEAAGIPEEFAPFVPAPEATYNLWPGTPPGGIPEGIGKEKWRDVGDALHSVFVSNVSIPTLAYYPAEEPNGASVLVCPGGGYSSLAYNYEGADVAKWFANAGISAFVLKYRVPSREGLPRYWAAFQDAQRAIRIIRAHAEEWKLDPNKVGVAGFSAGGHLAIETANESNVQTYEPIDDIDKYDVKPNFAIPIYPGYLIEDHGKYDEMKISDAIPIDPEAPPHFIAVASDDVNRGFASAIFYCELKKRGVLAELHIPLKGGHGFGIRKEHGYAADWILECQKWLRAIDMIP